MNSLPTLRDPDFLPLLKDFSIDELESAGGAIYGLWPDLTLAYMNAAWARFAFENGANADFFNQWGIGRSVLDAIAEPLRPFFIENYRRSLEQMRPWEHIYQCPSALRYREFHMVVYPLGQREGLLVVNSLLVESAHTQVSWPPIYETYHEPSGMICQCCHCRRTRRADDHSVWDWVAEWVRESPSGTSHGICPPCFGFYYSTASLSGDGFADPFSTSGP